MGDRSTVHLHILTKQLEQVQEILIRTKAGMPEEEVEDGFLTVLTFYEVNYGNLDFLRFLKEAGIAYESEWESGSEFEAGTDHCKFSPEGDLVNRDIYDSWLSIPVDVLMLHIDDYEGLKCVILNQQKKIEVPPLDEDQIQYGKLYLAKKLIGATS